MSTSIRRALYWTPRILGIAFAVFISLFALDVFDGNHGFWQTATAFLMHMIPTAVVVGVLAVAWRWEWVGGLVFTALAILYVVTAWGRFHWSAYALISGPLLVLGGLFFANWLKRSELRPSRQPSP